jgi:hypothetical protein
MEGQNNLPVYYPFYPSLPEYYNVMPSSVDESDVQNSTSPPEATTKDQNRNIAATACLPCRTKHLKCEGQVGVRCARCTSLDLECSWVKSRRGYRRRPVRVTTTRQSKSFLPRRLSMRLTVIRAKHQLGEHSSYSELFLHRW